MAFGEPLFHLKTHPLSGRKPAFEPPEPAQYRAPPHVVAPRTAAWWPAAAGAIPCRGRAPALKFGAAQTLVVDDVVVQFPHPLPNNLEGSFPPIARPLSMPLVKKIFSAGAGTFPAWLGNHCRFLAALAGLEGFVPHSATLHQLPAIGLHVAQANADPEALAASPDDTRALHAHMAHVIDVMHQQLMHDAALLLRPDFGGFADANRQHAFLQEYELARQLCGAILLEYDIDPQHMMLIRTRLKLGIAVMLQGAARNQSSLAALVPEILAMDGVRQTERRNIVSAE